MDNKKHIEIHTGVMRAFKKFKHHEKFTKRIRKFLEEEFPGYTIYISVDQLMDKKGIGIWGKDIPNSDRFSISFYDKKGSWQEKFLEQMDIYDLRDYLEREEQERSLDLEALNKDVETLINQIDLLKGQALDKIKALPIPKASKIRKDSVTWDRPSYELRKKFPLLFE